MQVLGFSMLAVFFAVLYYVTSRDYGYWVSAKIWLTAIAAAAFAVIAIFLIKAGSL